MERMIAMALGGDIQALRWCCDRLVAPLRARGEALALNLAGVNATDKAKSILAALSDGALAPDEAHCYMSVLTSQAQLAQTASANELKIHFGGDEL